MSKWVSEWVGVWVAFWWLLGIEKSHYRRQPHWSLLNSKRRIDKQNVESVECHHVMFEIGIEFETNLHPDENQHHVRSKVTTKQIDQYNRDGIVSVRSYVTDVIEKWTYYIGRVRAFSQSRLDLPDCRPILNGCYAQEKRQNCVIRFWLAYTAFLFRFVRGIPFPSLYFLV